MTTASSRPRRRPGRRSTTSRWRTRRRPRPGAGSTSSPWFPGVAFVLLALVVLAGGSLPAVLFRNGGVLWGLLIVAGVLMLSSELRKARSRR